MKRTQPIIGILLLAGTMRAYGGGDTIPRSKDKEAIPSLADHGARVPRIQMQHVAAIPKTAAGKAPLVKSNRSS